MPMKPSLSQPRLATHLIAVTFAGIIAAGILASVTELFVRDGWPMERLAVAERAHVAAANGQKPTSALPFSPSISRASSGVATSSPRPSMIFTADRTCEAFDSASVPGPSHKLSSSPTRTLPPIAADCAAIGS